MRLEGYLWSIILLQNVPFQSKHKWWKKWGHCSCPSCILGWSGGATKMAYSVEGEDALQHVQSKACVQEMTVGHKPIKHLVQSFARLLWPWGVPMAQWQWIEQPYGGGKTQSRMLFSIGEFILVLQVLHFWSFSFRFSFAILWEFYLWKRKRIVMGTTLYYIFGLTLLLPSSIYEWF